MLLAPGGVVEMEGALGRAALQAGAQGAVLPGPVAGHSIAVGNLVAVAARQGMAVAEFLGVGPVGGHDAVVQIEEYARLGLSVEEGQQLGKGGGVHGGEVPV